MEHYTKPSKTKNKYICPFCSSGTGKNGTGAFDVSNDKYYCFSCGRGGDVFSFIGEMEQLDYFPEQVKKCVEILGLQERECVKSPRSPLIDTRDDFIALCHKNIHLTDYASKRGITDEIISKYKIGYCERFQINEKAPISPRLIIPTGDGSFLARDTRDNIPKEQQGYTKIKVGSVKLFNINILDDKTVSSIIICEGEIDTLNILGLGCNAIGLGGVNMADTLINVLKDKGQYLKHIYLLLDNDERGTQATKKITEAIQNSIDIRHILGECKDVNDAYLQRPEDFKKQLYASIAVKNIKSNNLYIDDFIEFIENSKNNTAIPTGIGGNINGAPYGLDMLLGGGLYNGVYILGAVSSLGKSTFMLQIMDNIAQWGRHCLYFSLEMSRHELIAKSISRISYDISEYRQGLTTRDILSNNVHNKLFIDAIDHYNGYNSNCFIVEADTAYTIEHIKQDIARHIIDGVAPVVFIDYLQIIQPVDVRTTEKQHIDYIVSELKRLSRLYNTPIIAISSLNRANYTQSITMSAFKESGGIEYSSDVLIGLQFGNTGEKGFSIEAEKSKDIRDINCIILKNRNGACGSFELRFNPKYNTFFI